MIMKCLEKYLDNQTESEAKKPIPLILVDSSDHKCIYIVSKIMCYMYVFIF